MNILEEEFGVSIEVPDSHKGLIFGAVERAREEWDAADDNRKAAILRARVLSPKMFIEALDSQSESLRQAAADIRQSDLSSPEAFNQWVATAINTMIEREEERVNLQHESNRAPVAQVLGYDWISTISAEPYRHLQRSISRPKEFKRNDAGLPHLEIPGKNGARTSITFKPDEMTRLLPAAEYDALVEGVWRKHSKLSTLDADCLTIVTALWLEKAKAPADVAVADIDDFLAMRGLEKKPHGNGFRGGYTAEQREQVIAALCRLGDVWMEWEGPVVSRGRGKKARPEVIASRAFIITDVKGQQRLDGRIDAETIVFQPGRVFGAFLQTVGRQTALLAHKALQYDPYRQEPEKKLTYYLSWQWRVRAREANYEQPFSVQRLLNEAGIETSVNDPARTKDRLEKALDQLRDDKIVNGWDYNAEQWDEERDGGKRGWRAVWLNATIVIEAPDVIKDHYRKIERETPPIPKPKLKPGADLAARMAAERKARNISQSRMAEILGVTQAQVSNMERGRAKPGAKLRAKIEEWLKTCQGITEAGAEGNEP